MKTYKVTVDKEATCWYDFESGKLHREDGPAVEWASGGKEWDRNGKLHREDGPACEYANGSKYWYLNDVHLTEQQWKDQTQSKQASSCEGKTVTIDGQTYKLDRI